MSNFVLNIWKGAEHLLSASATDAELVAQLKIWAEEKGYRVTIADYTQQKGKTS